LAFTSFEINCALPWYLLTTVVQKTDKILTVDDTSLPEEILTKIKKLLLANGLEANETLSEFERSFFLDTEDAILSVASKLKLSNSIELLNIWTSEYVLNIFPMEGEKWKSLDYPFVDIEDGFGKICPIATKQTIENYLTQD